jgi:hypothetical protein
MMWLAVLAAPLGTLFGSALHEASHAIAAELLGGTVVGAGWQGGLTGGPYISWQAPEDAGIRVHMVGVAPVMTALLVGVIAAIVKPRGLVAWFGICGMLAGLLRLSEEDVNPRQARETFEATS